MGTGAVHGVGGVAGRILNALRSAYPIMKGLSVCVSGTVMPCMIETRLWGNINLPEMDTSTSGTEAFPQSRIGRQLRVVVNAWKQWAANGTRS